MFAQRLRNYLASDGTTDNPLTGSYVYNSSVVVDGLNYHTFIVSYDPDENDGVLNLIVQLSDDDDNVADASSEWTTYGTQSVAAGVGTFAITNYKLSAAAAGTKVYGHIDIDNTSAYKIRVGVKETFTAAGTNFGNVRITQFSSSSAR